MSALQIISWVVVIGVLIWENRRSENEIDMLRQRLDLIERELTNLRDAHNQ